MKLLISQEAQNDIDHFLEYYRKKGQLKYGRKVRARVILKVMRLKDFPLIGQIEENLSDLDLGHRYLVEGDFKIIYRIVDDSVLITNVFDTRQDPEKM